MNATETTSSSGENILRSNKDTFIATAPGGRQIAVGREQPDKTCERCGKRWGRGPVCRSCKQVEGLPVGIVASSPLKRMAAALLDILLAIVTLNVGYAIWSIVVMFNGQTPAQQLLKMKCVHLGDHETAGWWRMVGRGFGRTAVLAVTAVAEFQAISLGTATAAGRALEIGAVVWLLGALFWCFLDRGRQQLWDKLANTVVVDDPERVV